MDMQINSLISGLNHLAQGFCNHALSMLWQSAVLVMVLLVADFLLRKHVRAVWRYCLWMLLFAKLMLPPSFASPTGIAYWISGYRTHSAVVSHQPVESAQILPAAPPLENVAPTVELPAATEMEPVSIAVPAGPAPAVHKLARLTPQALLFLGWLTGVTMLSLYRVRRVWFVRKLVSDASEANPQLLDLLDSCRETIGLAAHVQLKVSREVASPSVCGLIRPAILLPGAIADNLSPHKLRPILIHELAHIKRCDLMVNLVQTVLQIVYFYNPLLWLANAVVRRVREQAVDETVLVALGSGADNYTATLIDVAEMARRRPNIGLRLIGVVESENALERRIRHIATRPVPTSAKLGITGFALLVIAAATLLPMAKAKNDDVLNVADDGSTKYKSIQAAIDEASPGATIRIAPGQYEEHVKIDKPLTLEGAGWQKTAIITRNRFADVFEDTTQSFMLRAREAKTDEERKALKTEYETTFRSLLENELLPTILVSATENVTIRNLKITAPGRLLEGRTIPIPIVKFTHAKALLTDCVVIDTPGDGIHIVENSDVEIRNTLVAAVWSTGIAVSGRGVFAAASADPSSMARIIDSEIRNCHHRCVTFGPGAEKSVVKRCRISGSAWHGIRYDNTSPTITDNIIFANARSGIYAAGTTAAAVKNNVFFANDMCGMSCWSRNADTIEGNTFIGNERSGLEVLGQSKPTVRKNIFSSNPTGVTLGDIGNNSPNAKSSGTVDLQNNIFWNNGQNVTVPRAKTDTKESTTEPLPIDEKQGNIEKDPLYADLLRKDFSLKPDSPARRDGMGVADPLKLVGPWPLQPEEIAIIPDGDTRDSRKWKQTAATTTAPKDSALPQQTGPATTPKSDLQRALDIAQEGTTITLPKGLYTEPITISKSITLKGASRTECIFEVTANQPAILIDTKGKGEVTLESLTVKWQLATSDKSETPFAVAVKDSKANIKDCSFLPLGNFKRCPVAIYSLGFSALAVEDCTFHGYEYTVSFGEGTEGAIRNCFVADSGHQGISLYSGAKVDITANIVTGSRFHCLSNNGGNAHIKDNLIINNANRGIYLGNRAAAGTVANNIIIGNATGISGFSRTAVDIRNNIIADSSYAALSMRDSCSILVSKNILMGNQQGIIIHEEGIKGGNKFEANTFWQNQTDTENLDLPADSVTADPLFADADKGDYSLKLGPAKIQQHGLTDSKPFVALWNRWKESTD